MTFLSRLERFGSVGSTNDVVAGWFAEGQPEVAVAVADTQTAGRGRGGRSWVAPPGAALLLSAGFRPVDLPPAFSWRLAGVVALAMAGAAESVAGLPPGAVGLKWPNDLVADASDGSLRKLGGLLTEAASEGDRLVSAVVGIGVDVDWPASAFPAELGGSMTSLRELAGDAVDREALLHAFLARLEPAYTGLRRGGFDADSWLARQWTTGRELRVETSGRTVEGRGAGVDPERGTLLVATATGTVEVASGEVVACRIRGAVAARV
ncbi:MAG: biotin--[acetyl-CoA-carboxylase] ligase [Chloroflexi bacterium GWC2_73_18]|nr:MAG: biotin--[acetyl-CoA-carboxylase] ligase [Chloroflexi bacterium GWC2_73_18]